MARPKRVPPSDSRESPAFWSRMVMADAKRRERQNEQFARFSRWHRGDLSDVIYVEQAERRERWTRALENMTFLATEASKADLFFRWPRFNIVPPYPSSHPLFSPALGRVETTYLTHTLRAAHYRRKARRCLQDALLGGLGVIKVTVDNEVVVDEEVLDAARLEATQEVAEFLKGNFDAMRAKDDQIHSVHIEIKSGLLSQGEEGGIALPKPALKFLRKHIAMHEAMKGSERPTETIRASQVRVRRVNPLDYFYDPTVDDRDDASWRACRYLLRKSDVLADDAYDLEARKALTDKVDRWEMRTAKMPKVYTPGSYDIPEQMVMVYEVFDLVDQKRRLYCEGADRMLIEEDRHDLRWIQPSGPFHELAFIEDTMEGQGVPPPAAFEGEQAAATHIAVTNVAAALQSSPRTVYDERFISADDAQKMWHAAVGEFVPVKPNAPHELKLKDMFNQAPGCEIPEQNMAVLMDARRGVDKRSGLGTSKMGGGEQASTATGAALGAEASTSISDDRAATVDEWIEQTARSVVRLTRRFTPKSAVVRVCGPEAAQVYPDVYSVAQVANDEGVTIIPGSSRRQNTAIDQKQLLDGITAFSADPLMQGPSAASLKIEMYRRYFDDGGVSGLDWSAVEQEAKMLAMLQQAQMMGAGGEAEGSAEDEGEDMAEGEGPPGPDDEGRSGDINDQLQGVANVGGGRIPTNASIGDRIRMQRGQAVSNVTNRA